MTDEKKYMERAIELAWMSAGHTRPNPPVGAVVVREGEIVGEGRHKRCGEAHAEVEALRDAGEKVRGATIYVTLEPCSKAGRVGACCDALKAAGVERVVWACEDPNPVNRGKAKQVLEAAGIETDSGLCKEAAWKVLVPFAKHVTTGLPFVTVKLAMSLDGKICDNWGASQWISGEEARTMTGKMREKVDVMLVGAETIRADNPSLLCHTMRNDDLWRAVVSRSGNLPKEAQIFTDEAKERTLVYRSVREAMEELGRRGFLHVLCEGGLGVARSLAEEGFVDEWMTIVAPMVIGNRPMGEAVLFSGGADVRTAGKDAVVIVGARQN